MTALSALLLRLAYEAALPLTAGCPMAAPVRAAVWELFQAWAEHADAAGQFVLPPPGSVPGALSTWLGPWAGWP